jgi:hypothetical protein
MFTRRIEIAVALSITVLALSLPSSRPANAAALPSAPGIGMTVNYVLPDGPRPGHPVPAIIKQAQEDGRVRLIVFMSLDDRFLRAPANGEVLIDIIDDIAHDEMRNLGTWHYVDRHHAETN